MVIIDQVLLLLIHTLLLCYVVLRSTWYCYSTTTLLLPYTALVVCSSYEYSALFCPPHPTIHPRWVLLRTNGRRKMGERQRFCAAGRVWVCMHACMCQQWCSPACRQHPSLIVCGNVSHGVSVGLSTCIPHRNELLL